MADADDEQHEEMGIDTEKVMDSIRDTMKQKLQQERWAAKKVDGWVKDIVEATLKVLADMKKPFKYVVTCVVMQRTGAGLSSSFSSLWDNMRDGVCSVPFETEHLHCVTAVYWLKID